MSAISAEAQIGFLNNVQRLLSEGQFTATYKFALLLALADICVEKGPDSEAAFVVRTDDLAEKFILYYWRQIRPFATAAGHAILLRQNTNQSPTVIRVLQAIEAEGFRSITDLQQNARRWNRLVASIRSTICGMPLGKLQTLGNTSISFLYDDGPAKAGRILESIELKPGAAFCLRKFHGLITDLVRGAWVRYVRRYNADDLGSPSDLDEFLFGSERAPLQIYVPILTDLQESRCFYCHREMKRDSIHVDHFIPWSRYPVDLGHNFVLAHSTCNSAKADHLAAAAHLESWVVRNRTAADYLKDTFGRERVLHNSDASHRIAEWAYRTLGQPAMTWRQGVAFEELPSAWEQIFKAA